VLVVLLAALAAGGCGGMSNSSSDPAVKLQRQDLAAVSRALAGTQSSVGQAVAAGKRAWPLVVNGLSADMSATPRLAIAAAGASAARVRVPRLLEEAEAVSLTGPAAELAGQFRDYVGLTSRGWKMIVASMDQIEHGPRASARFARDNVALYIESVYDGNFTLAQIGKHLRGGYRRLGGPAAFAGGLSQPQVNALASAYSEANDRLHPHVGVRLGS
jgi:hypothetical protein